MGGGNTDTWHDRMYVHHTLIAHSCYIKSKEFSSNMPNHFFLSCSNFHIESHKFKLGVNIKRKIIW
jgi:hypothetical protein